MTSHSLLLIFAILSIGLLLARYLKPALVLLIKRLSQVFPEEIRPSLLDQPKTAYSLLILS